MSSYDEDRQKERAEYSGWILSLKKGDEFALPGRRFYSRNEIYTVERLTVTQIIARHSTRINRGTGRVVGAKNYSNIKPVTQEIRDEIELRVLTNWLCSLGPQKLNALRAMKIAHNKSMSEIEVEK